MITVGFLAGALIAVLEKETVQWTYFAAALGAGIAGVVLVQTSKHRQNRSEGKLSSDMQTIEECLKRIAENIKRLNAEKKSINTYDMRHRLDELVAEELTRFVKVRESIAQVHGLQAYADVMSCFAAGERYLNRVWSASADGYIDEVNEYLDKAQEQFVESLSKVRRLKNKP